MSFAVDFDCLGFNDGTAGIGGVGSRFVAVLYRLGTDVEPQIFFALKGLIRLISSSSNSAVDFAVLRCRVGFASRSILSIFTVFFGCLPLSGGTRKLDSLCLRVFVIETRDCFMEFVDDTLSFGFPFGIR